MLEQINFQYPVWYIPICLILGLIISGILYFKDQRFKDKGNKLSFALGAMRWFCASILALLLLSPFIKQSTEEEKEPVIVILEDKSLSISEAIGSEAYLNIGNQLALLNQNLSENFDIDYLGFGTTVFENTDTSRSELKSSNLSNALQHIDDMYSNQNLGAVILISDGLFNEGRNPIYQNFNFRAPVHTLGLGDTTQRRDLFIKNLFHNRIAYLGDKFSLQVDIQGHNAGNSRSRLSIYKKENGQFKLLQRENINVDQNDFFSTREFILPADEPGLIQYSIRLDAIPGESTLANNIQNIFVEILDARQKIILIANSPHPDVSALKKLIEGNKNYELDIQYPNNNNDITSADFVIFHNLPSRANDIAPILQQLNQKKTPRMFIVGAQTDLRKFNSVQNTIDITGGSFNLNEVQAIPDPSFQLFFLEDNSVRQIPEFIPLLAPFGEYSTGPNTHVMYTQKIGDIETDFPLFCFSDELGIKTSVIAAEGLWKWKMYDFLQHKNELIFNDLFGKLITYTTVKEDKRKFRVNSNKNLYKENERIYFTAQLYNNSYQLVNDPEIFFTLKNEMGNEFTYNFSKSNQEYRLDAGLFPAGDYQYEAYVDHNGNRSKQKGSISVQAIQLEQFNLTANHRLLNNISSKYNGSFFLPEDMNQLEAQIQNADQIKPVVYSTSVTSSVIHFKYIFFILFFILTIEWVIRRYYGSY